MSYSNNNKLIRIIMNLIRIIIIIIRINKVY